MMNKKTAMTLAEILLVLTIVGVISALTVPGLQKHVQRSENAQLAKKGYSVLSGALDIAVSTTDVPVDNWPDNGVASVFLRDYIAPFVHKGIDCSTTYSTKSICFDGMRPYKSNTKKSYYVRSLILPDGITISGSGLNQDLLKMNTFVIDVNGPKEPNMEGVDMFLFDIGKFDANCDSDYNGQWKFCPRGSNTKQMVEEGWNITYW